MSKNSVEDVLTIVSICAVTLYFLAFLTVWIYVGNARKEEISRGEVATQKDKALRQGIAQASGSTRAEVENKVKKCVASGDCLKVSGRGAESVTTIDLGLLEAGAVPCLADTCSFEGKENSKNLDVEADGTMIAWSEKNGVREGYIFRPSTKNGALVWEESDFDKKAAL